MSTVRLFSLLFLIGALAACAPRTVPLPETRPAPGSGADQAAPRPESPVPAPAGAGAPDLGDIDKRLFAYEDKFLEWQALAEQLTAEEGEVEAPWRQCLRMASSLYDSYDRLHAQAAPDGGETPGSAIDPWEVFRADIRYLESDCDAIYAQLNERLASQQQEANAPAAKLEVVVARYLDEQRYEDALVAYRNLERRFPGWQPSLATRRAYGLALLYSGHLDKAVPVLKEVLPQLPPNEQLASKRLVADLLWATYQFDEARSLYQSLAYHFATWKDDEKWVADQLALLENLDNRSEEMDAYVELLRVYLTFDGRVVPKRLEEKVATIRDKFPGSMVAERGRQLLLLTQEQSRGWLERQLAAANAMVAERRFADALAILKDLKQKDLPSATGEQVQQLMDETLLAEAREKEKDRLRLEQDLVSRWEEATHLLDLEEYDEASRIFASLLGTEYDPQAKDKLQETANRAASEMRRQAANLFVKARESGDPDHKLDLLLESRRLLKTIIEKYPGADIITKVTRNLEVIDQHIRQLKPDLLLEPPVAPAAPAFGLGAAAASP